MNKLFGTVVLRMANVAPIRFMKTVMSLGRAAATVFRRKNEGLHKVLIGKDTRISGYMLETALAWVLLQWVWTSRCSVQSRRQV